MDTPDAFQPKSFWRSDSVQKLHAIWIQVNLICTWNCLPLINASLDINFQLMYPSINWFSYICPFCIPADSLPSQHAHTSPCNHWHSPITSSVAWVSTNSFIECIRHLPVIFEVVDRYTSNLLLWLAPYLANGDYRSVDSETYLRKLLLFMYPVPKLDILGFVYVATFLYTNSSNSTALYAEYNV